MKRQWSRVPCDSEAQSLCQDRSLSPVTSVVGEASGGCSTWGRRTTLRVQACAGIKEVTPAYLLKNREKAFGNDN